MDTPTFDQWLTAYEKRIHCALDALTKREMRAAWDHQQARSTHLIAALDDIRRVADAHHADEPAHALLHCLTAEIPAMVSAVLGDLADDEAQAKYGRYERNRSGND